MEALDAFARNFRLIFLSLYFFWLDFFVSPIVFAYFMTQFQILRVWFIEIICFTKWNLNGSVSNIV
jgi:hypothetical protein